MTQYLRAFVFEQETGYKLKKIIWVIDLTGNLNSPYGKKSSWGIVSGFGYSYTLCLSHEVTNLEVQTLISTYEFRKGVVTGLMHYWLNFGDDIRDWRTKFPELLY